MAYAIFLIFFIFSITYAIPLIQTKAEVSPSVGTQVANSKFNPAVISAASNEDALFLFREPEGSFVNMEVDGIQAFTQLPKKREKLPMQKITREELPTTFDEPRQTKEDFFASQPGVAPKFTGAFVREEEPSAAMSGDTEHFNFGEGPVINPAATYLEGGNFDKITTPKCRMVGCTGPLPNDGSFGFEAVQSEGESCHQTFVPMNGCADNKGYPLGMLCSICCQCTNSFIDELKNTRGYKEGYSS